MAPHQERVVNERDELADKTHKLGNFMGTSTFRLLDSDEQDRLFKQYAFMRLYLDVLGERIATFVK